MSGAIETVVVGMASPILVGIVINCVVGEWQGFLFLPSSSCFDLPPPDNVVVSVKCKYD